MTTFFLSESAARYNSTNFLSVLVSSMLAFPVVLPACDVFPSEDVLPDEDVFPVWEVLPAEEVLPDEEVFPEVFPADEAAEVPAA